MNQQKQILGHPAGLFVLFATEMWERFSYYGMRALLVLYMVKYLLIDPEVGQKVMGFNTLKSVLEYFFGTMSVQAMSSQIYGLYTGLVYATPFFGGILADRVWGQRKTVYIGGFLMAIGHFLMAFESCFLLALIFLIFGCGAFKPNISTQVGLLYPQGDHRRDGAFTIFYMGINLGAFFSPLICGTLGQTVGWHYGFAAAGIGMLAGLTVYHFGKHLLPPDRMSRRESAHSTDKEPLNAEDWKRIFALIFLGIINVAFWGVYEQQGNTMQLWADDNTRWTFFGFNVPSTWYQSFNAGMIFMLAPLLDMFWNKQSKTGKEPTSVQKMGIGCIILAIAYVVMIVAAKFVAPEERGSLMWLTVATLFVTIGELYISPIGLSLVTKVSPPKLVSTMMGVWFLSTFIGNYFSGYLGTFYEKMPKDAFFTLMVAIAAGSGLIYFVTNKHLQKAFGKGI